MKVLITGATGYLGASLTRALLAGGHAVMALGRDPAAIERLSAWCGADAVSLESLCADLTALEDLPTGVDVLIHAAALRDPQCAQDPAAAVRINVQGTYRMLRLAAERGVRRVVYVSSQSVYGAQPAPWRETLTPLPDGVYALTKLCGERLVAEFAAAFDWAVLRLSRLYGVTPFRHAGELLDKFARLARLGQPLPIHGDGEQRMDLLHVADAAACVVKLLRAPASHWNTVYNVGAGGSLSLNDLVAALAQSARTVGLPPVQVDKHPSDGVALHLELDTARAREVLGWLPQHDLKETLKEYFDGDVAGREK